MAKVIIDPDIFKIECPKCNHKNTMSSYIFSSLKLNKSIDMCCSNCNELFTIFPINNQ